MMILMSSGRNPSFRIEATIGRWFPASPCSGGCAPPRWRTARMPDPASRRNRAGRRSWSVRSARPISDTFGQATGTNCCPAQDPPCWASSAAWFAQRLGVQNQRIGKAVRYLRKGNELGASGTLPSGCNGIGARVRDQHSLPGLAQRLECPSSHQSVRQGIWRLRGIGCLCYAQRRRALGR